MCVLAVAWRAHPAWRLVVAANRDERHDRPAAALARWDDPDIAAGRDLQAGGTWLGVSSGGRFAAVTNVRSDRPPDPLATSRGAIVVAAVAGIDIAPLIARCNPCHAVIASVDEAVILSNRSTPATRRLEPCVHAVSNGPLDAPWRKATRLQVKVGDWLEKDDGSIEALLEDLRDRHPPPGDADDPAAIFIDNPVYGTRCSTVVTIDVAGAIRIVERRYDAHGEPCGTVALDFGTA